MEEAKIVETKESLIKIIEDAAGYWRIKENGKLYVKKLRKEWEKRIRR